MDKKIVIVGVVVAVVVIAAAAAFLMSGNGDDDKEEKYTDASQIGASFSKNYSGFFGKDFYLDDSANTSEAKVFYPNGSTSSYGSNKNSFTFYVFSDAAKAMENFDTNKADYNSQIGTTPMGGKVLGTTEKSSLTDAIGYYNNLSMGGSKFCYLNYTGYCGNFFFEGYIYLKDTSIEESSVKELADAIANALKNPVSTDKAKKYTEPEKPAEYKGAALVCNKLTDFAKKYGSSGTDYAVTSDSSAMNAKLATSDGKYYVEVKISSDAKSLYDAEAADLKSQVGTPAMSAVKLAVNEKTGLDDGTGWYYNTNSVKRIDYAGYSGNYYVHLSLRSATDITDTSIADMVKDLATGLKG